MCRPRVYGKRSFMGSPRAAYMPPLLCPHLHGLVVGAACQIIIQVDQSIGIHRVAAALGVTVNHKHTAIPVTAMGRP